MQKQKHENMAFESPFFLFMLLTLSFYNLLLVITYKSAYFYYCYPSSSTVFLTVHCRFHWNSASSLWLYWVVPFGIAASLLIALGLVHSSSQSTPHSSKHKQIAISSCWNWNILNHETSLWGFTFCIFW